jgi:hypothetical protein
MGVETTSSKKGLDKLARTAKRHHFLSWRVHGAFQVGSVPAPRFLVIYPGEAFQALQG